MQDDICLTLLTCYGIFLNEKERIMSKGIDPKEPDTNADELRCEECGEIFD